MHFHLLTNLDSNIAHGYFRSINDLQIKISYEILSKLGYVLISFQKWTVTPLSVAF